jgi:hypothetical protein
MKAYILLFCITLIVSLSGCKKYLDVKPDKTLAIPSSVKDLQALLDNNTNINGLYPDASNAQSDDYFIKPQDIGNFEKSAQLTFVWDANATVDRDWLYGYTVVETCNVILDEAAKLSVSSGQGEIYQVLGSAYFVRGFEFFQLANVFAMPYKPAANDIEPGIPLRLSSDITAKTFRSTLLQTYIQILSDLKKAAAYLPKTPLIKSRPSKTAAFAALSRVYLVMQDYENAKLYADSCLLIQNQLIDYNELDVDTPLPFDRFNMEVIFHSTTNGQTGLLSPDYARVDTTLYNSYSDTDDRKNIFFTDAGDSYRSFKGGYSGDPYLSFNGLATDEVILNRAECNARVGKLSAAATDLNTLLSKRYNPSGYIPVTEKTPDLLATILLERRKELAFRGQLRWTDLRRLNFEGQYAKTLIRNSDDGQHLLVPKDKRYALLIPPSVIQLTGIQQNAR